MDCSREKKCAGAGR